MKSYFQVCLIMLLVAVSAAPGFADILDCGNPALGASLDSLEDGGRFIKYHEKGGVAYYNYTGACRLPQHDHVPLMVIYAAVDGKLYARFTSTNANTRIGVTRDDIVKRIAARLGQPGKTVEQGDWSIVVWEIPDKKTKFKLKFNNVTKVSKTALYYEPLRPAVEAKAKNPL